MVDGCFYLFDNRKLPLTCVYDLNQCFDIVNIIVVSNNSPPMIDNTVFFIFFKTVQQGFNTIPSSKYSKSIRFNFCKKPFPTIHFTKIAIIYALFNGAISIFAPLFIRAIS